MEKLTLNVLLEGKSSFAYLVSQRDNMMRQEKQL